MEPDERQDSSSKLADVQTEPETTTEPTTSVVKAEPRTSIVKATTELATDDVKAAKMKKQKILNVLNKERN